METNRYQGSQVSKAPNSAPLPAKLSPPPPGFTQEEWEGFKDNVLRAHREGLIPQSIKTPEMALVIALKGRELGLDPLYALSKIHVINGKPGLESELMLALVKKKYPDAEFRYPTPLDKQHLECTIETRRGTQEWQAFRFTMEDAVRAGLVQRGRDGGYAAAPGKQVWVAYPQDMTRARAISRMCRAVYPECIMGLKTPEELQNLIPATSTATVRDVDARFSKEVDALPPAQEMPAVIVAMKEEPPSPKPIVVEQVMAKVDTVIEQIKELRPVTPPPATDDDPGAFVIKFGRLSGKTLKEVGAEQLRVYHTTLLDRRANGVTIPDELIAGVERFLKVGK